MQSTLRVRDLYDTYNIETIFDRRKQVSIEQFSVLLQKAFNVSTQRKLIAGKKETYCPVTWQPTTTSTASAAFSVERLVTLLPKEFHVIKEEAFKVETLLNTPFLSNDNIIQMNVTFEEACFSVTIRGKPVTLEDHHISSSYNCSVSGLDIVLKQLRTLPLCEGYSLKKTQVEQKENYIMEVLAINGKKKKVLRSKNCKQLASLTSTKGQQCTSCKRMTITYKEPDLCEKETIRNLMPGANESLITLVLSQITNSSNAEAKQNRWDKTIIHECLSWYTRSPQSYLQIKQSGLLLLPSPSLLVMYKNSISHKPGLDNNIFSWMDSEATRLNVPDFGRVGGLLLDEMSIQQKIELQKKGKGMELVGFVDLGDETEAFSALRRGIKQKKVGTHVLQFLFQGLTGFRFPMAHFISDQVCAPDLYILVWDCINKLSQFGFETKYISMDGAVCNRQFMKIHFPEKNAVNKSMKTPSPCNPTKDVIFIMDPSHTLKKIRNNILKSGNHSKSTRAITLPSGNCVHWKMWIDAFQWDKNNPIQIHRKLTNEHIFPSQSEKMRNQLAEDALNSEMLNLMTAYQEHLGQKGKPLDGAIEILHHTSVIVDLFRDKRPINDENDLRLMKIRETQLWFLNWEKQAKSSKDMMSYQSHEDVQSSLVGFKQLCTEILTKYQGFSVMPAQINSDAIENIFCQHRGKFNGLNTNPTALQYRRNINAVILGQSLISKKSNAKSVHETATNFSYALEKPLNKTVKRRRSDMDLKTVKCIRM